MDQEKVKLLRDKGEQLGLLKATLSTKKVEFEELNAGLIKEIQIVEDSLNSTKIEIKAEAIEDFKQNGIKKLYGGIGIRVSTGLIYDEIVAIAWAKEHMPVAIKEVIDKKQFETYAKGSELEFVKKTETISATFPKEIKI